ncbi:MAG: hypothetical protein NC420_02100 [Eubacterium sp.]|nr:hypothetical protein [Eubacterium sp.]MCM1303511.1 hypothetical protein [Butyrivibrio sp.]MCM1342725.1 hypothetical protein [Muribaculaceae bacterium]MCM1410011.1 hypothetical protein [Lachnospiraceae bacterium]
MFKKIVMAGLAAATVLSVSACGGESDAASGTTASDVSLESSAAASQTEEASEPAGTEEQSQEPEQEEAAASYVFSEMPLAAYEVTGLRIGPDETFFDGTITVDGYEFQSSYLELTPGENTFVLYCLKGGDYSDSGRSYATSMSTIHSPSGSSPWEAHVYTSGDGSAEYVPEGYSKILREETSDFTEETNSGAITSLIDPWTVYIKFSELYHPDAPQEDVIYVIDIVSQGEMYDESAILSTMVSAFEQYGATIQEISLEDAMEKDNIAVSEGGAE